jgi:hypothetical protein
VTARSPGTFLVEIEEALGPGLDYGHDPDRGVVVTGAREGSLWLGVDRGFVVDSDDGRGHAVAVLVALPSSSFRGARIEVELVGGLEDARPLLVARLPGASVPIEPVLRAAGRADGEARWIDARRATEIATGARRAFRERRGRGRITGGRAWLPPDGLPRSMASRAIYSVAERALDRLPPRYLRGLEGALDPDERLHYSIRRPWRVDAGLLSRARGTERRSGLLLLTDREILWLVDHSDPDSYLSDWGVDVELLPVERLTGVQVEAGRRTARLAFVAGRARLAVSLPAELERDVLELAALAERFLPAVSTRRLSRTYETERITFVEETAARFGQLEAARALMAAADREAGTEPGGLLAFLYSPRREGQRHALGLWLSGDEVGLLGPQPVRLGLGDLAGVRMALSPLSARLTIRSAVATIAFPYPGPLAVHGAVFLRTLRRAWANAAR